MQQPEISIHPLIGRLRFIGETNGSDKNYSFSIFTEKTNDTVHLFESAIDLLSYATLQKLEGNE